MQKISIEDLKPYLESLRADQKDKLLYRLLKKDQPLIDQLYYKYIDPDSLDDRFMDFQNQVKEVLLSAYKPPSDELFVAKGISEAKKIDQ